MREEVEEGLSGGLWGARPEGKEVRAEGVDRVKCSRAAPKRGLEGVPGFISWEIPGNPGKRSLGEARIQKSPAVV